MVHVLAVAVRPSSLGRDVANFRFIAARDADVSLGRYLAMSAFHPLRTLADPFFGKAPRPSSPE